MVVRSVRVPSFEGFEVEDTHDVVDVIVVGSGAAGLAAAGGAVFRGASVIVLEERSKAGGTTGRSGGQYWVPDNSEMKARGFSDDPDAALKYMARLSYPHRYNEEAPSLGLTAEEYSLLHTYVSRAPEAIEGLNDIGFLESEVSEYGPAYQDWVHDTHQYDYHADLQSRPPVRGRHLNPRGGFSGADLISSLVEGATRANVDIRRNHRVVGLLLDEGGSVTGVEALFDGRLHRMHARRGVIFGSGGFAHSDELVRSNLPDMVVGSCAAPSNTGDFLVLCRQVGADIGNINNAWWNQVAVEESLDSPSSPAAVWLPYGDSMIMVNKYGNRVVNEKMVYHERSQVHFEWDPSTREYPNSILLMLFDHSVVSDGVDFPFRWPVPLGAKDRSRYVVKGDWWEELADKVDRRLEMLGAKVGGVRLSGDFLNSLLETIDRFNAFAGEGHDRDFRRDETEVLGWHGPSRGEEGSHGLMHPFPVDGPFYCVILGLGILDTNGGPRIDEGGRILAVDGSPIGGLYGAGNCVSSPAGRAYWSAGTTIGLALTFGYMAGLNAGGGT